MSNYGKASQPQKEFYLSLCTRKRVTPASDYEEWTYDKMRNEIDSLRALWVASDNQIAKIKTLVTQLQGAGMNVNMPSDESLFQLTGGEDGTASKYITSLQSRLPDEPTPKQLDLLFDMCISGAVPVDRYNVELYIELDEPPLENGVKKKKRKEMEDLRNHLKEVFTKSKASEFIEAHRKDFSEWKYTRATYAQIQEIRQLENELTIITDNYLWGIDFDEHGNIFEIYKPREVKQGDVPSYTPLTELEIRMFSKDDAVGHIKMLKGMKDAKERKADNTQPEDGDRYAVIEGAEEYQKVMGDFEEVRKILVWIQGKMGQADDDLVDYLPHVSSFKDAEASLQEIFYDNNQENVRMRKQEIRDFMTYAVEKKFITARSLERQCEKSELAMEILTGEFNNIKPASDDEEATA